MVERDRFELDLAAALRAYLEEAPTDARPTELARQFATAYPHRRAALDRWGFGLAPAMGWLLLLAGLLVVLVGGALIAGSQLRRFLPAVVPPVGQVFECPSWSTPDEPGPIDQAGPPEPDMDVALGIAFDRRAGRLVTVTSAGEAVETWTFDVCTNTWAQMHPNREPPGFDQSELVYDIDSDATIMISHEPDPDVYGVSVWAYDLQADTWTAKGAAPTDGVPALAYDPVSGLVVATGYQAPTSMTILWNYDVESDTWTPIRQANAGPPDDAVIAYDDAVDRLVAYAHKYNGVELVPETWLFDVRTGTWSRSSAQTPEVLWGLGTPNIVYDEAARRTVIMAWLAAAYDASANRWEMLGEYDVSNVLPTATMVYDAVNERLVGPGPYHNKFDGVHVDRAAVFTFDPDTREWTVVLEPGNERPAPATLPAPTSAPTPAPTASPTAAP